MDSSRLVPFIIGLLFIPIVKRVFARLTLAKPKSSQENSSSNGIYNLSHGKLNLNPEVPMWMSMGYWSETSIDDKPTTLAVASRMLLSEVLKTAGFCRKRQSMEDSKGERRTKALIDLGFGCGEQTIYINSPIPLRISDKEWWDTQPNVERFDYIGITLDKHQFRYAETRLQELHHPDRKMEILKRHPRYSENTQIFQGDAAKPENWDRALQSHILETIQHVDEVWVLGLDAFYHFSPSRWPVIHYASHQLNANLMAFDLCLARDISLINTVALRLLTALMGAPWANFVSEEQYRDNLVAAGYQDVLIKDVSDDVFGPLSEFLQKHDYKLRAIGEGLGQFHLAKWMFSWWARTGIVRGVIVIAKKSGGKESQSR
ncbi:hypothetical protein B0J11DRAFT_426114 [Dendryphion nanum]|uniref:Uncharacterized protein n=1 Tax=Dendryphion nanum TaxID=256645 RepID=A0A9P9EEK8_9PLEO|nr:hypothetical protein B0J11DRAFT_426114 [Dendryphion nanum]